MLTALYEDWFRQATKAESSSGHRHYVDHFREHMRTGDRRVCDRPIDCYCGSFISDWMDNAVYVELRWAKVLRDRDAAKQNRAIQNN